MKFFNFFNRAEKLRARAGERIEALSATSTGWRMNRKVGLTFGAIVLAMTALASMYEKGLGGLKKDAKEALVWYLLAGQLGYKATGEAVKRLDGGERINP